MKDIQRLKIWPSLKREGFTLREYKTGRRTLAKGAVLTLKTVLKLNHIPVSYEVIEIEPLVDKNQYKVTYDDPIGHKTIEYFNARQLEFHIFDIIKKFKK